MDLHRERRSRVLIGYDFDVCTAIPLFGGFQRLVEFLARGNASCEPSLASKGARKFSITSLREIVVARVRVLTEKSFDQVARVIEHEYYRLQTTTCELTDLLCSQLM